MRPHSGDYVLVAVMGASNGKMKRGGVFGGHSVHAIYQQLVDFEIGVLVVPLSYCNM